MRADELLARYAKGERHFQDACLMGVNLRGADLMGINLRGAYLMDANLREANFTGADFRGAALRDASLRDAYLTGAYLRRADLRGADFTGTALRGADLMDADLGGAVLSWSSYDLLSEILWRAADTEPRMMLAAYVGRRRDWCWQKWGKWQHPEREWALAELAKWITVDDGAPDIVRAARGEGVSNDD